MNPVAVPTMVVPLVTLLLVALIPNGLLALSSTVPAFLWSPNQDLYACLLRFICFFFFAFLSTVQWCSSENKICDCMRGTFIDEFMA